MVDAIAPRDRLVIHGMRCFDAAEVYATHQRVGPSLVVGVDAADFTKIMLCRVGTKAVEAEVLRAFGDFERG